MKRFFVLCLLAPPLAGQDPEPAPADPAEAFRNLTRAYGEAQREHVAAWRRAVAEAEAAGNEKKPAFTFADLAAEWMPRFRAEAERFAGTDGALPFLTWMFGNGDDEAREAILAKVLAVHLRSPELGDFVGVLGRSAGGLGRERVMESLTLVHDENPDADVRARALFERGELRGGEEGLVDIRAAAELAEDERLAAQARGVLFEKERLQVGMEAPDIVGKDLDGVEFKLSDYRGKVVMLDFWGDW